jgi:hypothetical protein
MNQQRLKLKPPRRRPTLGLVLALERRDMVKQHEIDRLHERLRFWASEYRKLAVKLERALARSAA